MKTLYGKRVFGAVLRMGFLSILFTGCAIFHQETLAEKEAGVVLEAFKHIETSSLNPIDLTKCRYLLLKNLSRQQQAAYMGNKQESSCLDEFSGYITPAQAKKLKAKQAGHFDGIGVELEWKNSELSITAVKRGS